MNKHRLAVIGNGMAGARFVEELVRRDTEHRLDIAMFGDEPYGNYNRILLSAVLEGSHSVDAIALPLHGDVDLRLGARVVEVHTADREVELADRFRVSYDVLVLATGSAGGWIDANWILATSVLLGLARAVQMPALQALTPSLVPAALLPRAVAASSSVMQGAIVIGPALGGAIYAWATLAGAGRLGAAPGAVRGMVLRQVSWMAGIGVVVGVGLAMLLGFAGRALLYGLAPTDPTIPAAAVLALASVILAAAYWPARRAAHIDPVTALRGD